MYRVMIRVMFHDIKLKYTKKKSELIWAIFIVGYAMNAIVECARRYEAADATKTNVVMLTLLSLVLFGFLMKHMRLRLCQALYISPLDEKERLKYISAQLGFKIILQFTLVGIVQQFTLGNIFVIKEAGFYVALISLCFFTLLQQNLFLGVNALEVKKLDENGYVVWTREEELLKLYWTCILILEWMAFSMIDVDSPVLVNYGWIIFFMFLIINIVFSLKCTKPLLLKMCVYENAYCQKPKEEVIQYDI